MPISVHEYQQLLGRTRTLETASAVAAADLVRYETELELLLQQGEAEFGTRDRAELDSLQQQEEAALQDLLAVITEKLDEADAHDHH